MLKLSQNDFSLVITDWLFCTSVCLSLVQKARIVFEKRAKQVIQMRRLSSLVQNLLFTLIFTSILYFTKEVFL